MLAKVNRPSHDRDNSRLAPDLLRSIPEAHSSNGDVCVQVQDGDMIDIDVGKKAMTLEIPEQVHLAEGLHPGSKCRMH